MSKRRQPAKGMLTTAQAAELAGISRKGILQAIERGRLKAVKFGRDWMIDQADWEAWLSSRQVGYPSGRPRHRKNTDA